MVLVLPGAYICGKFSRPWKAVFARGAPLSHSVVQSDALVVELGAHMDPLTASVAWVEDMIASHINLEVLHWCESQSIQLSAKCGLGKLNILADLLSWLHMVFQSEWNLVHEVLKPIQSTWFRRQIDLFDSQFSPCLSLYVSLVPDPAAGAVDILPFLGQIFCSILVPRFRRKVLKTARDNRTTHSRGPLLDSPGLVPELHFCHVPSIKLPLGPWSLLLPRSGALHRKSAMLDLHAWLLCRTCCLH